MATYNERYYAEFRECPLTDMSFVPAQFRVSFRFLDYTGESSEIELYKEGPVKINAQMENPLAPIRAKVCKIRLRSPDLDAANSFFVTGNRDIQIVVETDYTGGTNYDTTEFSGWLLPTGLTYDYKVNPFALEVNAVCGLSTLKDFPILNLQGKRMVDRACIAHVVRTALYATDLFTDLLTSVNLFEISDVAQGQTANGLADVNRDPLWQTLMPTEALVDEKNVTLSGYKAITNNITEFVATICQIQNNRWALFSVPQMGGGWDKWAGGTDTTIRARTYSSGTGSLTDPAADANVGNEPIDLNVYTDPFGDLRVLKKSPKAGKQSVKPGVRLEQTFGRHTNQIGDFSNVDSTGLPVGWTVNNIVPARRFVAGSGTDANPFGLTIRGLTDEKINNETPYVAYTIVYGTDSPEYKTPIHRTFVCEFELQNLHAAKVFFGELRDDGKYLFVKGDWAPYDTLRNKQSIATLIPNVQVINGRDVPKTGRATIRIDLGITDRVISFTLYLCMGEALNAYDDNGHVTGPNVGPPDPRITYYNPRIEYELKGLNLDGTQQTIVKTGQVVSDTSLTLTVGDVPTVAQPFGRVGTLYHRNTNPTRLWYSPDADVSAPGHGVGGGQTLLSYATKAYAKQAMFGTPTFSGTLIGRNPWGPLSVLHIGDAPELGGMIWTQWEWDLRDCTHSGSAQRLMSDLPDEDLPDTEKLWQTPDGTVPMNEGDDGSPVEPADPHQPYVSPQNQLLKDLINVGVLPVKGGVRPVIPGFTPLTPGDPQGGVFPIVGGVKRPIIPALVRKKVNLTLPG